MSSYVDFSFVLLRSSSSREMSTPVVGGARRGPNGAGAGSIAALPVHCSEGPASPLAFGAIRKAGHNYSTMTVKEDLADAPPLATVTASASASDTCNAAGSNNGRGSANNNAEIPLAEAVPVPIPIPVPPPSDSKVVKKTTKTTKTYTIPAPSGAGGAGTGDAGVAAPSAPPADNGSSSVSSNLLSNLGRQPVSITCPHCGQVGLTRVDNRCDAGSGASAAILGVVGCFCCICLAFAALLPCCVDKMKSTEHRCGKCNRVVGKVRSFSDC